MLSLRLKTSVDEQRSLVPLLFLSRRPSTNPQVEAVPRRRLSGTYDHSCGLEKLTELIQTFVGPTRPTIS